MPQAEIGDLLLEHLAEHQALWARAHQAHLSTENVEQLWYFIQTCFAEKIPDSRNPGIALRCPLRTILFRVLPHRAKLQELKFPALVPHARLPKQHRATGF